jgi:uncharacterized protein YggE
MKEEKIDLIAVWASHREWVSADSAALYVAIKGESFFTGSAALKKAKEVSSLVSELTQELLEPDHITLESVRASVKSGVLGASSSATYRLKIVCPDLAKLADVLGIVTSRKSATLSAVDWKYKGEDEIRSKCLKECLRKVKDRGEEVASALGVSLTGVHSFSETWRGTEDLSSPMVGTVKGIPVGTSRSKERVTAEILGMEIANRKQVGLWAEVSFRVSEMK